MADYIGIGAGAHGRFMMGAQKYASRDHAAPEVWLERVSEQGHGSHAFEMLSAEDRFHEALMMGLRLSDGVSIEHIEQKSGLLFDHQIDAQKFETVQKEGWMIEEGGHLCLTQEGRLRLNSIIPFILK